MEVKIDCDKRVKERGSDEYIGGWYYDVNGGRFSSYAAVKDAAIKAGHTIDNAGWKHKMLMWNWHSHSMDRYPGWEIEKEEYGYPVPAFAKLEHINKKTPGSDELCNAWDDVATVDFYQRDFSYDGSVFVGDGDRYGSGWWFATIAERDRFLGWARDRMAEKDDQSKGNRG